jgi:4-coumarate--CoA ligase
MATSYTNNDTQELIKYKGLQVAPAEIEGLLITHPDIMEAAVVGVPEESAAKHKAQHGGDSVAHSEVPRAYIVRMPRSKISENEVKSFVEDRLAQYKQLRGGVVFIDDLPKNVLGKILRRELRERGIMEVKKERAAKL